MSAEAPNHQTDRLSQVNREAIQDRRKRTQYERQFESALALLEDFGQILWWETASPEERSKGIHYLVETAAGIVPFGITSSHRKAQEKRKRGQELQNTTINLIGQHERGLKPLEIIGDQILSGIQAYFASRESAPTEVQPT
ncbi:MAG: hypothetical protein A3F04_02250 [Candidatus Chisholmbacteria bacterium RIFCSPHIGHO2_12_FULL_49_9]|uniref:Uncharacterized protein n=1 Tax=Candidatus Chisholmbacteria bacterium RIFCSPHIGHO2_01_FULL_52_32 TaxID=1797591 RepID=A0A1G1VRW9_9BACT|nr:MAG: hypothetical protein A2786_01320 [Candidatus Chisholmbacteria bacterium RIFCSPHIGHO2_01_FULL_52_32]OGY19257.1 MAG: hypothetical protein A3F04_02250 [Candidatus Chisholmbacteria bacterium RIFCSPHIGHO2_12_FULL_49_9]OGY20485.1 MAG: hypothetical protein A2900_05425 [Candidatus Chisholmbacteria bacterium RIFCSPLOWO2_01_FULL_50_28]